jgi:predicted Ser/Thr protein kinase
VTGRERPLRPDDPTRLGRYEVIGRLGEGGMGTVYLGRSPDGQLVAVKVIRLDLSDDPEFRARFREEVERARQVPPFCTAEVLDADPEHEQPYLVVEYVDGPSLASVIEDRGPLSTANLHALAIGVATALTAIHGAGVIHRDLKPSNVLLAPGSPKVIDFGIARAVDAARGLTRTDQQLGTVAYMAPERFGPLVTGAGLAARGVTQAADVFAWGAVVAYAGTGRSPFTADSPAGVAARIMTQAPDLSGLAPPLRALVGQALAKDPAERPTARQLLDRLLSVGPRSSSEVAAALARQPVLRVAAEEARAATELGGVPVPAAPSDATTRFVDAGAAAPAARPVRRWRWIAFILAVLAASATVVGVWRDWIPVGGPSGKTGAMSTTAPGATAASGTSPTVPTSTGASQSEPPLLRDRLASEGRWKTRDDPTNQSTCGFAGALVVTRQSLGTYRCPGPVDPIEDFSVAVDIRLLTESSCATIWFRFADADGGYALRACATGYQLVTHGKGGPSVITPLWTHSFDQPLPLDTVARVGIVATGRELEFQRDGRTVGTWRDDTYGSGRLVLGISQDDAPDAPPPYRVSFANIEIRPRSA